MELNFNGPIAKIYRWFFSRDYMPKSLCPYFWSLVFMWIAIIPYALLVIPFIIFNGFEKTDAVGTRVGASVLLWFCGALIYCFGVFVTSYWTHIPHNDPRVVAGIMTTIAIICIGIGIGYNKIKSILADRKYKKEYQNYLQGIPPKTKKPGIVTEFIKATYNRYCPKINWRDEN